ncbi:Ribosome-releasing factor 2, mitochondrial [Nowakowskiella sp. JEL0078]|nr:Ribosome-releasing factor 2, mitochondrial [Nowakowskiella sp. JEL0078]
MEIPLQPQDVYFPSPTSETLESLLISMLEKLPSLSACSTILDTQTKLEVPIFPLFKPNYFYLPSQILMQFPCFVPKDVDQGSTVTDYLPQERDRGITITSACIPLSWPPHQPHTPTQINLIDTPGHIDFSLEVTRTTRVLDSAILLIDGVAGVQAQTHTVFRQSQKHALPLVVFVNKMDREGSSVAGAVKSLNRLKGLQSVPVVLQMPVVLDGTALVGKATGGGGLEGVLDFVEMAVLTWNKDGSIVTKTPVSGFVDTLRAKGGKMVAEAGRLLEEATAGRIALVETLASLDEIIVESFFESSVNGDHLKLPSLEIKAALRRGTLSGKAIAVLCGSAFKNMGVQPVLDAVTDFLPSPDERPNAIAFGKNGQKLMVRPEDQELCALAFKIVQDEKRGPLVFVRVYSGKLDRAALLNSTQNKPERPSKILQMYADDFEEIPAITAGNIGAVVGFRYTCTGDTLLSSKPPHGHKGESLVTTLAQLDNISIPPPVFMASISPATPGKTAEKQLSEALTLLQREDPSVRVTVNEETNQTVISGMGELHLEIVADRIRTSYRVLCKMGNVRINYRETLIPPFLEPIKTTLEEIDEDEESKSDEPVETDETPKKKPTKSATTSDENYITATYEYKKEQESPGAKLQHALVTLKIKQLSEADEENLFTPKPTTPTTVTATTFTKYVDGNQITVLKSARKRKQATPIPTKKPSIASTTPVDSETSDDALVDTLITGIASALSSIRGSFPLVNLDVTCTAIDGPGVTLTSAREAAVGCVHRLVTRQKRLMALKGAPVTPIKILEPVMTLVVGVEDSYVGVVVRDLGGQRRGSIIELGSDGDDVGARSVVARVPLANLVGYSTSLRGLTSGSGEFTMSLKGYGVVAGDRESEARKDLLV